MVAPTVIETTRLSPHRRDESVAPATETPRDDSQRALVMASLIACSKTRRATAR